MTTEFTNEQRAERAEGALREYEKQRATDDYPNDLSELAGDLLADLFHLAAREGWDMRPMLAAAEVNYESEKEGEE